MAQYIATIEGIENFSITSLVSPPFIEGTLRTIHLKEDTARAIATSRAKARENLVSRARAINEEVAHLDGKIARKPNAKDVQKRRKLAQEAIQITAKATLTAAAEKNAKTQSKLLKKLGQAVRKKDQKEATKLRVAVRRVQQRDAKLNKLRGVQHSVERGVVVAARAQATPLEVPSLSLPKNPTEPVAPLLLAAEQKVQKAVADVAQMAAPATMQPDGAETEIKKAEKATTPLAKAVPVIAGAGLLYLLLV